VQVGIKEVTIDENHGRPPYNTGGPFFNVKFRHPNRVVGGGTITGKRITASRTGLNISSQPGDWVNTYTGGFVVSHNDVVAARTLGSAESIDSPDDYHAVVNPDDMSHLAPRAHSRLRPKIEKANLGMTIVEMREAPQMLKQTGKGLKDSYSALSAFLKRDLSKFETKHLKKVAKSLPKEMSDHYLNLQFGWRPFVDEVIATCDVVINFDRYVENAKRLNDKVVKRRWSEQDIQTSSLIYQNNGGTNSMGITPVLSGTDFVVAGSQLYQIFQETLVQTWYEGAFRSYYPEFDEDRDSPIPGFKTAVQGMRLAGAIPNMTLIYNLCPWTWLSDWFVNVGDNLQVFEDLLSDSVAAKYCYLMRRTYTRFRYKAFNSFYGGNVLEVETTREVEVKRRVAVGNPFSLSLQPGDLSDSQKAILSALGISKLS
jgi:hypothetical protein